MYLAEPKKIEKKKAYLEELKHQSDFSDFEKEIIKNF